MSKNTSDSHRGKVAVVTGGADGLGRAASKKLLESGAFVCLFDIDAARLAAAKTLLGENCRIYEVDITDPHKIKTAVDAIVAEFSSIDILINSAGITGQTNVQSHEVKIADFDRVCELNVRATFLCCQAVLPLMLKRNYGRILNVASIAGKEGNAGMVAYSTSKAAVIGMTKAMGKEYAETGITVNAIAPAVIQTELVNKMPTEQVNYMTSKIPMKRCGTLDEFATMAAFIVSEGNSFTTGFTFDLSGGRAVY
ncbi:MAG: SDR family NAD(P)-dependent oxidoreductase [Chthoniobacterales bacterium]